MRRILLVAQGSRLGEIAHIEPLEIGQLVDDGQPSERFQVGVDSRWGTSTTLPNISLEDAW